MEYNKKSKEKRENSIGKKRTMFIGFFEYPTILKAF
jgi:hypothetical protein